MARLLTLVAAIASLVAFIATVTGSQGSPGWWAYALNRASYVLVVLAIATALMARRSASLEVVWLQVAATATALVFAIVGLVKYYDNTSLFPGSSLGTAYTWLGEAEMLSLVALAFGLTLARKRRPVADAAFVVAAAAAVGCGIYAITLKQGIAAFVWWELAGIGAFLAAAAAATIERGSVVALRPPVAGGAGGYPGSDAGVE